MGVRGWGLGFGIWDVGFEVWGLGFGVWDLGFGVWSLRCGFEEWPRSLPFLTNMPFDFGLKLCVKKM